MRREQNRRLWAADAKARCGSCKRVLPTTGVQMRWGDPALYCSSDCLADAEARVRR